METTDDGVLLNEEIEEDERELSNEEDTSHRSTHSPIPDEPMMRIAHAESTSSLESAFEQEKRDIVHQLNRSNWMTAKQYQEINRNRPRFPINFLDFSPFFSTYEQTDPEKIPIQPDPDIVLTIQFQNPDHITRKSMDYLVLGHQRLTTLKDVIECRWDHLMDHPKLLNSFFLIENTFYSDMRHSAAIDLTRGIREWAEKKRTHDSTLPMYQMYRMEEVDFIDLTIRLNVPYVYVHQGNCEHVFVIRDVRLIHSRDSHDSRKYPKQIFHGKMSRKTCTMCRLCPAKHITIGDRLAPDYICYFCDTCYDLFHYDEEGALLYEDFQVYPYYPEL